MQKNFPGRLRVLEAVGDKLCRVEILALNDQITANGWRYTNLEQHLNQFQDIPILTAYTRHGDGIGSGHNFTMRKDEDGEEYCSFTDSDAERIVGWVPNDAEIRLETRHADGTFHKETGLAADSREGSSCHKPVHDGKPTQLPYGTEGAAQWIIVTGSLWRWYSRELVDKITASKGGMDVSIETLVTASHMEPDGTEVEEEYTVLGITVLGNGTEPAVKGAGIRRLNEARKRMRPEIEKAATLSCSSEQEANTTDYGNQEPKENEQSPCSDASGSFHPERSNAMDEKELVTPQEATEMEAVNASSCKTKDGACSPEKEKEEACKPKKEKDAACDPEDEKDAACKGKRKKSAGQTCEEEEPDEEAEDSGTKKACSKDSEVEALRKENEALKARLSAFEKQEKARRCETAVSAAQEEFEKVNRLCAYGTLASSVIEGIKTLAAGGGYSDTLDFEGNWYGDSEARRDVRALCMLELMKSGEALEKEKQRENATGASGTTGNSGSAPTFSATPSAADPAPRYRTWALAQNSAGRESGTTVYERLKAKAEA